MNITGGRAKLELKQRRGESVDEKGASDITELVIYLCHKQVISKCQEHERRLKNAWKYIMNVKKSSIR